MNWILSAIAWLAISDETVSRARCRHWVGTGTRRVRTACPWALGILLAATGSCEMGHAEETRIKVPRIEGDYVHIYRPAGDVFPGPDEAELKAGQYYDEWVPNDHCFVQDDAGRWHLFGITHPRTDLQQVHAGENQSFHAVAPQGTLKQAMRTGAWKDRPKVLPPAERPGEPLAKHAPFIVRRDGRYHMIYGPPPIRYAISEDLNRWMPHGTLPGAPWGRDPNVLVWNGLYHLSVCGLHEVRMAVSHDLTSFGQERSILQMKDSVDPESPTLIRHAGTFYLFVCGWDGIWDRKELDGAYQHITYVYQSDDPWRFDADQELTRLHAHAPEIFQDEDGDWYISSAQYPYRGVSLARLVWNE